ncbi:pyridoxal-phosphate dependent enzyme [Acinetobacter johnsonii]|uniref:1-aminocyclopropane-1-carboxylate deaminase/D-cysteine desulfhydrase n=1 Tax=Acinetobacter johnsonii TaxID=40214 RepID=A0A427UTW7_ACIJO|nr:pyridoxal-phosphate dependent enzyme [Acinetobacter johnsonii]MDH1070620.1 pyridoxal-phosphate dependent enzyme [Acinetobacter johnsonii]RSE24002.1 1-aminocyclopropane-1-carboxylate deaminase/D-cysteine desulfhydrase [Acinetobacter johnsonii]
MFEQIAQSIPYQHISVGGINISIKRLDLVHPYISGNKFFKLKYNLLTAQKQGYKKLLTFGGAYSNHIAATAYAAQLFGFESLGIIRGEELASKALNTTLNTAQQFGMQLQFVTREAYRQKQSLGYLAQLQQDYPDYYVIPEGGTNSLAIQGCQEILNKQDCENFDLICCAVGTGGTITGLIEASHPQQQVLGFSALKGDFLAREIQQLTHKTNWKITDQYCCGGYAKTTPELLQFIRTFEHQHQIPLEQIYTGKMLLGLTDLIQQGTFPKDHRILVIHSGGLQGRLAAL